MCLVRYVSLCERSLQSEPPLEQTASFCKHRGGFRSLVFSCPPVAGRSLKGCSCFKACCLKGMYFVAGRT